MAFVPMKRNDLPQTLADSDFPAEARKKFLSCYDSGDLSEPLHMLTAHRGKLLDHIHKQERSLECVDYLIYQIKKVQADR